MRHLASGEQQQGDDHAPAQRLSQPSPVGAHGLPPAKRVDRNHERAQLFVPGVPRVGQDPQSPPRARQDCSGPQAVEATERMVRGDDHRAARGNPCRTVLRQNLNLERAQRLFSKRVGLCRLAHRVPEAVQPRQRRNPARRKGAPRGQAGRRRATWGLSRLRLSGRLISPNWRARAA